MSVVDEIKGILGDTASASFEVTHFCDTGFAPLNKIVSGDFDKGFPVGRVIEMFGPPSSGKTAIATNVMADAIRQGGFAMFMDHERSFDITFAQKLGLETDSGRFAHLMPETLEESFTKAIHAAKEIRDKELIEPDAPIVAVFDSLAAMIPRSKSEKELTELTMADSLALAKAASSVLPSVNLYSQKYNMMVLILNQIRENPGVSYGDPTRTPGGKAPGFYASVRVSLRSSSIVAKEEGAKEKVGQTITATAIKSKLTRPFQQCSWNFLYQEDGSGMFDVTGGLIDYLVDEGKLEKKGGRIVYNGTSYWRSALIDHINENKLVDELNKLCRS